MSNKSNILVSALVALVISVGALFFHGGASAQLGGRIETILQTFGGGIQVSAKDGTAGTQYQLIKSGTCFLLANATVAATTTANVDCAFTGVKSGDLVSAHLTASSSLASQYTLKGYTASTTSGYITFSILNQTGTGAIPSATTGFGSSTAVQIFRAQ